MPSRLRGKLTFANVVSFLALFFALGGFAFAATHLSKNSVGTNQIKKNAVVTSKIKNGAVTGAKLANGTITGAKVQSGSLTGSQINSSTLGTVPTAQKANTIAAPENWHEVGAPGQPAFQNGWENTAPGTVTPESVAFYKDQEGVVHLRGLAESGALNQAIFHLPAGYRPASAKVKIFAVGCVCGASSTGELDIFGSGAPIPTLEGAVVGAGASSVFLDGVTFRAAS
jgi:hypothetical protein